MGKIDFRSGQDGRCGQADCYAHNHRMGAFLAGWSNEAEQGGANSWTHAGIYCRQQFGSELDTRSRRLIFLGMLAAFVNGDACADWTDAEREQVLEIAWRKVSGRGQPERGSEEESQQLSFFGGAGEEELAPAE